MLTKLNGGKKDDAAIEIMGRMSVDGQGRVIALFTLAL